MLRNRRIPPAVLTGCEAGLSILLLGWALSKLPLGALTWPKWDGLHWIAIIASIAGAGAASCFYETWRLVLITKDLGERPQSFRSVFVLQLKSRIWGVLLPGSIAADGYLAFLFPDQQGKRTRIGRALLSQRIWGLTGWLSLGCFVLLGPPSRITMQLGSGYLSHSLVIGVLPGVGLLAGFVLWPEGSPARILVASLASPLVAAPWLLLAAWGSGSGIGASDMLLFQSLMMFGIAIPVSVSGIGLQEVLLLRLFPPGDGGLANLIGLSLALHLQRLLPAILGAMFNASTVLRSSGRSDPG